MRYHSIWHVIALAKGVFSSFLAKKPFESGVILQNAIITCSAKEMKILLTFLLLATTAFSAEGVFEFLREDERGSDKALVISFRSYYSKGHIIYFIHESYWGDYRLKFEPEVGFDPFKPLDPFSDKDRDRHFKISPKEIFKNRFKGGYFIEPDVYDIFALEGLISRLRKPEYCYLQSSSDVTLTWMSEGEIVKTESYEHSCFLLAWKHIRKEITEKQMLPAIPKVLEEKVRAMPEFTNGATEVTLVLRDDKRIRKVILAWGKQIKLIGGKEIKGESDLGFNITDIVDIAKPPKEKEPFDNIDPFSAP